MITTKQELREYIKADRARYGEYKYPWIIRILTKDEQTKIIRYLRILRKHEYYLNTKNKSILNKILHLYYNFRYIRQCSNTGLWFYPNVIGPGCRVVHLGARIGLVAERIGKNFTVGIGCSIGKKGEGKRAIIGNNVEMTMGSKIIGGVTIGDNSVITQNSVVIKDVPANSIAIGNPVSVIKPRKNIPPMP